MAVISLSAEKSALNQVAKQHYRSECLNKFWIIIKQKIRQRLFEKIFFSNFLIWDFNVTLSIQNLSGHSVYIFFSYQCIDIGEKQHSYSRHEGRNTHGFAPDHRGHQFSSIDINDSKGGCNLKLSNHGQGYGVPRRGSLRHKYAADTADAAGHHG